MKVLMLDVLRVEDIDAIEAVRRIRAGVAVEAPLAEAQTERILLQNGVLTASEVRTTRVAVESPETAALDRAGQTMSKPRPQPRPAPLREKRGRTR